MKRLSPRVWAYAIHKAEEEGYRCRVCKSAHQVELAHVTGRSHDKEQPLRSLDGPVGWRPYIVHPDRVVPLCKDHHELYDSHQFDLLPYLDKWEALQAVADEAMGRSNGMAVAWERMTSGMAA